MDNAYLKVVNADTMAKGTTNVRAKSMVVYMVLQKLLLLKVWLIRQTLILPKRR